MAHIRILAALLLLTSCGNVTEIVLVVDTDIANAHAFRIDVTYPDGRTERSDADLSARAPPRRLVLGHEGGPLEPVALRVAALRGSREVVAVERVVAFEAGTSLTLQIFLADGCGDVTCPDGRTCGNGGTCRTPRVASCEFDGRTCDVDAGVDAGMPDGGPPDGGRLDAGPPCSSTMVCGVSDVHLPGDRITPELCREPALAITVVVDGPTGPVGSTGSPASFVLADPGDYRVEIDDPVGGCAHSRTVIVPYPVRIDDATMVSADALRDLAARMGTGFVAGQRGAYAVDTDGWYDLRMGGASGDIAPEDQLAVVVVNAIPFFGPNMDLDAFYRIDTAAPFSAATHTAIALSPTADNHRIRAMGARVSATGPLALATQDNVMFVDTPVTGPAPRARGPSYDADTWIAVGEVELLNLGAIWAGRTDELVNRHSLDSGGLLNGGSPVSPPSFLGSLANAAVDDRGATNPSVWLCGDLAVARFAFEPGDWPGRSSLPSDTARWLGECRDIAIDIDGDLWIASGSAGLVRLAPDGTVRVVIGASRGLPSGTSVDRVAVASDAEAREVWILDASERRVVRYRADRLP